MAPTVKKCAHCKRNLPGALKYSKRVQQGPWMIYFYKCPYCGRWTGIDYKLEVSSKFTYEEVRNARSFYG